MKKGYKLFRIGSDRSVQLITFYSEYGRGNNFNSIKEAKKYMQSKPTLFSDTTVLILPTYFLPTK